MKYILFVLIVMTGTCPAASMSGFGARYYNEDTENYSDNHKTDKALTPEIILNKHKYRMEVSTIDTIANDAGVNVNEDEQSTWVCLSSKGINYWFISDSVMGHGDLTTIAVAKDNSRCTAYNGELYVSVNAPMFASKKEITLYFSVMPRSDIVMYYNDVMKSDEYMQSNSIQYILKDDQVQGIFISQGTTN